MPSLRDSRIELKSERYRPIEPVQAPIHINPAPEPPIAVRRSPVMISSIPAIAAGADGITRQFYGGAHVPTRRILVP